MQKLDKFKPKLSPDVKIRFLKEDERGKFYIIGITKNSVFLKVHQVGRDIIGAFDGCTSVAQISNLLKQRNVEVDLQRFISDLGEDGFIENYPYSRSKRQREEKLRVYYFAFLRNPEKILSLFHRLLSRLYKPILLKLFILFNVSAAAVFVASILLRLLVPQFFFLRESNFFAFVLYLFFIFPVLGLIHELAHAVTCFHYGGKPSEIGVAVYLFTFFFYAETSDTWLFDKKKSILVFLAGPLATLFIGNLFFLLYLFFQQSALSQLFIMIAFASNLSVLVGFNPLVEADGCYILQTLVAFPNIHSHLWSYALSWLKHRLGFIPKQEYKDFVSSYSRTERRTLAIYTPLALLMNCLIIAIIIPWSLSLVYEFVQLTLSLIQSFPNMEVSTVAVWVFQGIYLSLVFAFSIFRILKLAIKKLRRKRRSE
ncbi:MAG: metalloprotease family protein [Candidatus Bathyarchaeota archaeon]|nr:metalloprotease family protein [Candidatus Bathyarchaeota archaeon]